MNKNELKEKIAMDMGMTKKDANDILTNIFDTIKNGLVDDKKVTIVNFGSFRLVEQKARKARNPRTGDEVEVPSKIVVKFKPANDFKDLVSG
jgi:DNA-binding protein HU-beta